MTGKKFIPPRTTTAARLASTPVVGEILFDFDTKRFYSGDGVTPGGIELIVSNSLIDKALYYYEEETKQLKPIAIGSDNQVLVAKPTLNPPYQFASPSGGREVLTANRTYYVRTDGSDSNNGLTDTAGGAFLTIQKAIDVIAGLDLSIYTPTIKVGAGTYTLTESITINQNFVGSTALKIEGDKTTPTNVLITSSASINYFYVSCNIPVYIEGFHFTNTADSSSTIFISCSKAWVYHGSNNYGVLSTGAINQQFHLLAENSALISITSSYTISGGNGVAHFAARWSGFVYGKGAIPTVTITLTGTPAFTSFLQLTRIAVYGIFSSFVSFSGSATGKYYAIENNSIARTGGSASYFPGNASGTTATGGQYL